MITRNELKYYSSLLQKKIRQEEEKFIVEGLKIVEDGLNSNYKWELVFVTSTFKNNFPDVISRINKKNIKISELKSIDFNKISNTKSPQGIAAVFKKYSPKKPLKELKEKIIVLIDNISDPGNLGTILRTCDWFGIYNVLITDQSVEYLNPKVIRSSMGSIFHLNIYDKLFGNDLANLKNIGYQVVCSDIKGKNLFTFQSNKKSILTFSNESLGPSETIKSIADEFITIPGRGRSESLNVSSAAAIIIARFTNEP